MLDRPFYFILVLWGERFRNYFLDLCLPTLLSPRNLPALATRPRSKFLICTRPHDWAAMTGSAGLQAAGTVRRARLHRDSALPSRRERLRAHGHRASPRLRACLRGKGLSFRAHARFHLLRRHYRAASGTRPCTACNWPWCRRCALPRSRCSSSLREAGISPEARNGAADPITHREPRARAHGSRQHAQRDEDLRVGCAVLPPDCVRGLVACARRGRNCGALPELGASPFRFYRRSAARYLGLRRLDL